MITLDDTITAIATARGEGGLAVVRLSGPQALAIADRVFRGRRPLAGSPSHTLHHGWAVGAPGQPVAGGARRATARAAEAGPGAQTDLAAGALAAGSGERLDEVVAAVFRAPRSYTCEDVVELSCHGGGQSSLRVLNALLAAGARLAGPGEFTLRAFLNGRLDLAQAEAVADLIRAGSERAHRLALAQLAGELSARLAALAERVADAAAEVEARVDFAEDVGGVEVPDHVVGAIAGVRRDLAALLAGAAYGRALRSGVQVPIVGRPNVGKSSLFNALVGEPRAIVTALPGTTRDRVSETIEVAGIQVTLSDTAGLRETDDPAESLGVAAAERAIESAAAVLWVVDASVPLGPADRAIGARLGAGPVLVALNKCDLPGAASPAAAGAQLDGGAAEGRRRRAVAVSARTGRGLEGLLAALAELLGAGRGGAPCEVVLANPRHAESLARAAAALGRAQEAARAGGPGEIVALELREGLAAIGRVTGRGADVDLLERIFSRFCIGK
jgi:tRNA modification GTPase